MGMGSSKNTTMENVGNRNSSVENSRMSPNFAVGKLAVGNSLMRYQQQTGDARESLMLAIRSAAGGANLRKVSSSHEN
jgi:hypothetical protein